MDCKDTKKAIPLFLADELEGKRLKEFLSHMNECPDCKEEMTIQYLATEGVSRLEEGMTFDLDRELQEKLLTAEHREELRKKVRFLLIGIESVAILILIVVFMYVFL